MRVSIVRRGVAVGAAMGAALGAALVPAGRVRGAQVPNPTITAAADPFTGDYVADNVFDDGGRDFATSGNGAGTPHSTDPADGTWIEFDFGAPVTIDTFINRTRVNAVDVVGRSRLVFSPDAAFDPADPAVVFNPSGSNGAGLVQRFAPRTAQYLRWEVVTSGGTSNNLGARQMFFLNTPTGLVPLRPPRVYNGTTPFNGNYALQNAANDNAGRDGVGNEYASQGAGAATFLDFDFGSPTAVAGFDFLNREVDVITGYDIVFSDTADFASPLETLSFTASENGNEVNSEVFDPVVARYVRLQATSAAGFPNTGVSDILFYTPVPEPAGLPLIGLAAAALLRRRRARGA